ncbi:hypothetical protein MBLNU459_g3077t2 [Dothideomycetes sp. NU459]
MFDTTFSHTSESILPSLAPEDVVLHLLHDFDTLIRLNPDCKGYNLISTCPEKGSEYDVEDSLAFIPKKLWSGGVWYKARFETVDNGCDITIKAPGGFTSVNHWQLVRGQGGAKTIRIVSDARCSKTFAGFVKKFLDNSHKQLHKGLVEEDIELAKLQVTTTESQGTNL